MAGHANADWYLQDWARERGKRQADLVTDLGWLKNAAHRIWHSRQPYRRDILNQVADWLDVKPYELLMPPKEALALRRLRETAVLIAADQEADFDHEPAPARGRRGR
jgi:transcriptional regulator with XRE-family HTH domain